jgi:autotransporter translocation and assembly factor TamB
MKRKRAHRAGAIGAVAAAVALIIFAFHAAIARAVVAEAAGLATGTNVSLGATELGWHRALLRDVRITSKAGEPIVTIARVEVTYDLRDVLPGGTRRYGLESVELERPQLTIIRHADGTFNIPIPETSRSSGAGPPFIFSGNVRGGTLELIDRTRVEPDARRVTVSRVDSQFNIDTSARSLYTLSLAYLEDGRAYPIEAGGEIDVAHGFMLQRIHAATIPLRQLFDYAANNAAARMEIGELDGLDVHVFAYGPGAAMRPHVTGGATLRDGTIHVAALSAPISNLHGRFDVTDNAVTTAGIAGHIGDLAAEVTGGVYGLSKPQARFVLAGRAQLGQMHSLARFARRLPPVRGPVAFHVMVEGPAFQPVALVSVDAPLFIYNGIALQRTSALVGASARGLAILGARTQYPNGGGVIALRAAGLLAFAARPNALRLLVTGTAPANSLPFVNGFTPGMTLHGATLATADDPRFIETRGYLAGAGPDEIASAFFQVDSRGTGSVGPLFVGGGERWLYARVLLDHPHGHTLALVDAHDFRVVPAAPASLAHFRISPIPQFAGSLSAEALGAQEGSHFAALGRAALTNARIASLSLPNVRTTFTGSIGDGGTFALAAGGTRVDGTARIASRPGHFDLRDAVLEIGPALLTADGRIAGRHYDLAANVRDLDLRQAARFVDPRLAAEVSGSADADVLLHGSGTNPSVAGTLDAPDGSFYGEGFRALHVALHGNRNGLALGNGGVALGSSAFAFDGYVSPASTYLSLSAPHLDLADLNDFFNTGDMFAGRGHLDVTLAYGGGISTTGNAAFTGTRFRTLDIGTARARWYSTGAMLRVDASTASATGELGLRGTAALPLALDSNLDLRAKARNVAIGSWLPLVGIRTPIVGDGRADATVRGRFPELAVVARGSVTKATIGRVPVRSLSFEGRVNGERATLQRVRLSMPYLAASGSGTFTLNAARALDVRARATSTNVGALARIVTGRTMPVAGALAAQLRVHGTMANPSLSGEVALRRVRLAKLAMTRLSATIVADRERVALRNGIAQFARGRLLASASLPLHSRIRAHAFSLRDAPLSAKMTAQNVALSNFASLFPAGTTLGGSVDGSVTVGGTVSSPSMRGAMNLRGGSYSGPLDRQALNGITGQLALAGTALTLRDLRANVGGGSMNANGRIDVPNLGDPAGATLRFNLVATRARVDSPKYFSGQIDARIAALYAHGGPITIGGNVTVSHARIPVSALYHPSSAPSRAPALPIAFDNFGIHVGPDVRIQNSNVDVAGAGAAVLSGTLAAPTLRGAFAATGGTISFYQIFRVEHARIAFDPANGLTPYVDAVAATSVADPPTDIRIHVTGPATNMNLGLTSDPSYDRSQILGLLVGMQSFGAVQGVPGTTATPFSASAAVEHVGFGEANQVFTRSVLEPASTALGGALGVDNLQLYSNFGTGYGNGIGAQIEKRIAQHVSVAASANLGYPTQQMLTLKYMQRSDSDVALRVYQQQESFLNSTPPGFQPGPNGLNLNPADDLIGTASSGFLLSFQRRWWSCVFWHYSCSVAQR